jgi:hypothetical protein
VLTLKAAGLVDIDAGEVVRPGILRIDGDRIARVGGTVGGTADGAADDEVLDLGDLILLPGLMDMEVNLLMGGRGESGSSATGTQPLCFIDYHTHDMRIGYYNDTYVRTAAGWRLRTRAMTFIRRSGAHDSGRPHAYQP